MKVNPEHVYYNFHGKMPRLRAETTPAPLPEGDVGPRLLTDTTLRDGAQDSRFALFPPEVRVAYVDLLHRLDNGTGRIWAVETFIYQARDLWALDKLLERGYEFPKITTWIRATPKDVKELHAASQGRVRETGMLASSSDHHIFDKLGYQSKEEAIERYLKPIVTAVEYDITPRVHLEDTTRADIHGWVIPFIQTVLTQTEGRAKFRICDTIGWGSPDPYAALPFGIPSLVSTLLRETGAEFEFHGHNDFGLATANSIAAWQYGCLKVNVAFAGLGERSGNTALEQMIAAYVRTYGDPGFDLTVLSEMADLVRDQLIPPAGNAPLIGDVFSTQAGIHQSGVARQTEAPGGLIYLAYDPAIVGRSQVSRTMVGGVSGADGIVAALNAEAERRGSITRYSSTSRAVKAIYDQIQDAYNGTFDEDSQHWRDHRRDFYSAAEIWEMAMQFDESHTRGIEARSPSG